MPDASYVQTSFLGGEISQWAQGRFDSPKYKTALSTARNIIIVDEGAAPRRPGFNFLGHTRNGSAGRLLPFDFSEVSPYNMEFTDNYLRFWNGRNLVDTNDSQIIQNVAAASSSATAIFSIPAAVTWVTGDQVYFTFNSPAQAITGRNLINRQFIVTMLSATTFSLADAITGYIIVGSDVAQSISQVGNAVSSSSISSSAFSGMISASNTIYTLSATVNHIAQLTTPYSQAVNDWHSVRAVQGLNISVLLHTSVKPQALQVISAPSASSFANFSFGPASFQDGPYLDPPANAIATTSGTSGSVQIVVGYAAWSSSTVYGVGVPVTYNGQDYISAINNNLNVIPGTNSSWLAISLGSSISPQGFVQTDVGRLIRLFSAPPVWNPATTYSAGDVVSYGGVVAQGSASYFSSLTNTNTNNEPDISITNWVISPNAALYTWGTITQVLSANTVQVQINGSPLLYKTPCPAFRIGAWSDTTGWPTCGCYQNGRFWYAGAIPNRVDASGSNQPFNMAPTLLDGTVADNNAISYTFNSNSVDKILWMEPQPTGVLLGSAKGEYLLAPGASGPMTPTNIAESPATKYGSSNVLPVKTGLSMCFVQKYGRRLLEYLADVFSQRFYGPDLTTFARHIGKKQFKELAYQQEPAPIVWGRMGDGSLVGTTYRRVSLFSNQEPEFNAWHQHPLGSDRRVESICVGPSTGSENILDTLAMVTNDPATNIRFVESLTPLRDESDPLTLSWFLDAAVTPQAAVLNNNAITFYGLNYLNGRTVSVFAAALDCGDYLVENGSVTVPLGIVDPISTYTFDIPQFNILQPTASEFADISVSVVNGGSNFVIPCVIGFNYQSQGQLCRPILPADTGARNGPGFAKKKRTNRYGIMLSSSLGVRVGTSFSKTVPVNISSPLNNLPPYLSTYSGIIRETLPDDFSYNSMVCWTTTRPYPATVTAYGGFIETQDV